MIDLVNRHGDLFVLTAHATPSIPPPPLLVIFFIVWHRILGYPSVFVHKNLYSCFVNIQYNTNKYFPCPLCHLAKHKCLSYTDSISTISHAFDMLHVDI